MRIAKWVAGVSLGCWAITAHAVTINFRDNGTFCDSSFTESRVTVTGSSGTVCLLNMNGIGVAGGLWDHSVDSGESLFVDFGGMVVENVRLDFSPVVSNTSFRATSSIGTQDFTFSVFVTLFGGASLTSFSLTSLGGPRPGDTLGEILFDVVPVPEPGTLALFGLGLAGLGFARRRKLN